jgi:hypothetical protein
MFSNDARASIIAADACVVLFASSWMSTCGQGIGGGVTLSVRERHVAAQPKVK